MFNVKRLLSRLSIFSYFFYGRNSQNALSKWKKKHCQNNKCSPRKVRKTTALNSWATSIISLTV